MITTIWAMQEAAAPVWMRLLAGWGVMIVSLAVIYHFKLGKPKEAAEPEPVPMGD